jgi:hypothetical protein
MSALAELADLVANDAELGRTLSRDAVRNEAAHVVATSLQVLAKEADAKNRWKLVRDLLRT